MKIGSAFQGDYLKAADLDGKKLRLKIKSVTVEMIGSQGEDKEQKPVVYFTDNDRGLVLNKTNASMISEIAGTDETDDWHGLEIVLYSTKVDFAGRRVDAIRVDYPEKTAKKPNEEEWNDSKPEQDWKAELTSAIKNHCKQFNLDFQKEKFLILQKCAGTIDFKGMTQAQAKTAVHALDKMVLDKLNDEASNEL